MVSGIIIMRMRKRPTVEIEKKLPAKQVENMGPREEGFPEVPAVDFVLEPPWLALVPRPSTLTGLRPPKLSTHHVLGPGLSSCHASFC